MCEKCEIIKLCPEPVIENRLTIYSIFSEELKLPSITKTGNETFSKDCGTNEVGKLSA
jgi:hypothetical protein